MNKAELFFLLNNPDGIDASKTEALNEICTEFPYFQSARAVQLKGLYKNKSFKYNQALKKTAAYTIDRKMLFDFITSYTFSHLKFKNAEVLEEIEVIDPETVTALHQKILNTVTKSEITETKENLSTQIIEEVTSEENNTDTSILEIGSPINFSSQEPHSFNEWMQLISKKPIEREPVEENNNADKFNLIDKFIETNPKIKPVDKSQNLIDIAAESSTQNESLMTETLAKVYLEQKKYDNAIKAYRILSLKYPEKSSFFADRIKAIKILQKNKS